MNGPLYVSSTPHHRTGRSTPVVLGHEFSGKVTDVGMGVKRIRPGDRVAINAVDCCRNCEFCRRGLLVPCPCVATIGFSRDWGYPDYAIVPADCYHILRPNVSHQEAALVKPLSVALRSVKRTTLTAVGSRTNAAWIYAWLKDPLALRPGSMEPSRQMSDDDARAVTANLMSLKDRAGRWPENETGPDLDSFGLYRRMLTQAAERPTCESERVRRSRY